MTRDERLTVFVRLLSKQIHLINDYFIFNFQKFLPQINALRGPRKKKITFSKSIVIVIVIQRALSLSLSNSRPAISVSRHSLVISLSSSLHLKF